MRDGYVQMLNFVFSPLKETHQAGPYNVKSVLILFAVVYFFLRLKLYYDQGEIKRYNGKRRMMNDLKASVDKFAWTSEVYCLLTFNL